MIWCIKTYIIAYVKTQKIRFIIHYVKPTAQLLFKIRFPKVDQHAGGKWLIHDTKRRKDNQLQSLKLPCWQQNITGCVLLSDEKEPAICKNVLTSRIM